MTDTASTVPKPLIWTDPDRMSGAPCFMGTRVPVAILFEFIEAGEPLDAFLEGFPSVSREHAQAVVHQAGLSLLAKLGGHSIAAE